MPAMPAAGSEAPKAWKAPEGRDESVRKLNASGGRILPAPGSTDKLETPFGNWVPLA